MKKLMAMVLAVLMVFGSLTGCSKTTTSSGGDTSPGPAVTEAAVTETADTSSGEGYGNIDTGESIYPVAADLKKHKIGVIWYDYSNQLGASVKKNMEYLGKEFNCEIVFSAAYLPEDLVSETENLIQNGVEGIMSLIVNANMIEQCDKAGVYLAQFCNETTDEELLGMMKDSQYFVGMVNENDEACGEAMVDDLYARGCRNIVWLSLQAGASANHDNRVRGIEKAIKKYSDLNVLSNYRGDDMADALTNFAVTYPEMDGIITTGSATEEIYQVMSSEGLTGKVTFATIDIGAGTGDRLNSGDLGWIGGGQFPTSSIGFSLLYNALTGTKMLEDNTQVLLRQFMVLQNTEDYMNYVTYVEGDIPPYTGDEIKALIKSFNPDASVDLYNQYDNSYSIEDVVTRHTDLFN